MSRSSPAKVFFRKAVLQKRNKFTGDHPYRSVISSCLAKFLHKSTFLGMSVSLDGTKTKVITMA